MLILCYVLGLGREEVTLLRREDEALQEVVVLTFPGDELRPAGGETPAFRLERQLISP